MEQTITSEVPAAVSAFLATPFTEAEAVARCFADDAVVHDEGTDHVGVGAIRAWAGAVGAAVEFTRAVREVRRVGAATVVGIEVAGPFAGSPVRLHHHFTVDGDRIAALTICP